ncbi:MAG: carbohydrate ABC transporter permease, partial [Acetobacteraceae bacterium]
MRFAGTAALIAVMIVMLYPFWYITRVSLGEMSTSGTPVGLTAAAWRVLFRSLPILRQVANSFIVTGGAIALILGFSAMAGFAFARLGNRGSARLFLGVVATMMIPMQSIIVTEFANVARLGLVDNPAGAILSYAALGIPFGVFLMTTYYRDLPRELIEAALVDGMSYPQIFLKIALPLSAPALIAVGALQFVQIWDDLLVALIILQSPLVRTITVGLAVLQSGHFPNIPVLMAGSLLSALPAALVYLAFQRHL